jgi:hypothetical protein
MHYTRLHLAPGSRHTYDTGVRAYTRFAAYFRPRVPAFPATDEALQAFVSFQAMSCQYGTLKTYLYGLREYHLARGLAFAPLADRVGLWWTLKGIRRVHGRPAKPKQALTFPILLRVYHAAVGGGDGYARRRPHGVHCDVGGHVWHAAQGQLDLRPGRPAPRETTQGSAGATSPLWSPLTVGERSRGCACVARRPTSFPSAPTSFPLWRWGAPYAQ